MRVDAPALRAVARRAVAHLVLDDAARAAELAQRVEVAERGHVGIGGIRARPQRAALASYAACAAATQRRERAQEDELRSAALARRCRDRAAPGPATTGPSGRRSCRRGRCPGGGKTAVLGRSNSACDLLAGAAHRRGRSDDLRADARCRRPCARRADRWPPRRGRRPCRAGPAIRCSSSWMIRSGGSSDQPLSSGRPCAGLGGAVEAESVVEPIDMAEEGAGLADPGQARELVDGGDQKGGQAPIDRLVDGQDRQRPVAGEVAGRVGAADLQVGRRRVVRHAGEGVRRERRAAPGAGLERRRRALVPARSVAPHAADRRRLVGVALAAEPVRRGVGADPEADLDRPVAEQPPALRRRRCSDRSRISSSAQTTPAARASWSSVSRRSV